MTSHDGYRAGMISVIVPVYNTEDDLAACLESIAAQAHREFEVILVDDGSTDSSSTIARDFAEKDQRFRLISSANGGPGTARNLGLAEATGEYLRFFDSDDVMPPDSLGLLAESLNRSGSDFAVGSYAYLLDGEVSISPRVAAWHEAERPGITAADFPSIVHHILCQTKMYRRRFWDEHIRAFPEGVLYEDIVAAARGYASGRFDVLQAVVCHYRQGRAGSTTQNRNNTSALSDELAALDEAIRVYATSGEPAVNQAWLAHVFGFSLGIFTENVPRSTPAYWQTLVAGMRMLVESAQGVPWPVLGARSRLLLTTMLQDAPEVFDFAHTVLPTGDPARAEERLLRADALPDEDAEKDPAETLRALPFASRWMGTGGQFTVEFLVRSGPRLVTGAAELMTVELVDPWNPVAGRLPLRPGEAGQFGFDDPALLGLGSDVGALFSCPMADVDALFARSKALGGTRELLLVVTPKPGAEIDIERWQRWGLIEDDPRPLGRSGGEIRRVSSKAGGLRLRQSAGEPAPVG